MKFLNHIFNKHRDIALSILGIIAVVVFVKIFAADPAPSGGFTAGATLNPDCLPSDNVNCIVKASSGSGWGLTGNAGTVDGTNFIGTTNDIPFNIKVNNQKAGRIDSLSSTFLGYQAGNVSTDTENTGMGFQALFSNTGFSNTSIGYKSLYSNIGGIQNTAIGDSALYGNTTGTVNTATGYSALIANTTGSDNTANGNVALDANTTGNNNTAVGSVALQSNTTGFGNTALGYGADVASGALFNATAIGLWASVGASNSLVLGSIYGVNGATADTNVGIGTTTPTAFLDITAPTTAAASLRLEASSAVNPSSPNIGDLWFNGTNLNFRKDSGTTVNLLNPTVSYKVYVALLTQTGTSAPTATVLENTLGGTPVWSYDSMGGPGAYDLTLTGAFSSGKTFVLVGPGDLYPPKLLECTPVGINFLHCVTESGIDNSLTNAQIEIRVYP